LPVVVGTDYLGTNQLDDRAATVVEFVVVAAAVAAPHIAVAGVTAFLAAPDSRVVVVVVVVVAVAVVVTIVDVVVDECAGVVIAKNSEIVAVVGWDIHSAAAEIDCAVRYNEHYYLRTAAAL